MFGPASVAIFSTYRTISRVAVQCTAIFSHVLWPEFSRLYGQAANQAIKTLYLRTSLLAGLQAVFLSLVLYFISPWLLKIWTHDAVRFESSLMLIMLVYAAVGGVWHIPRVLLMATNQHVNLAFWTLLSAFLSVGFSWLFGHIFDLPGVAAAMVICELFIAVICVYLASNLISNNKTRKFELV
jgi:O-antigen/teichoic acid export membrane protein